MKLHTTVFNQKATILDLSGGKPDNEKKESLPLTVASAISLFYKVQTTDKKGIKEKLIIIID